jgi:uncharacterized protein
MKLLRYVLIGFAGIIVVAAAVLIFRERPDLDLDDVPGFDASAVSPLEYDAYTRQSLYLPMPDGVRLAVDVFLPAGGPAREKYPVVFEYSPYNRGNIFAGMPLWQRVIARWKTGEWGPVFNAAARRSTRQLLARGYAYVIADMRGTGASFGVHIPLDPQLGRDGKVIVDWIAGRPWCDGNIGMIGQSYHAWSQFAVASQRPRALKCIAPALIMAETYTGANRPGGIAATSWLKHYSDYLQDANQSVLSIGRPLPVTPVIPVVDEDGDGDLADEIPVMEKGDPERFTDDGEPRYADGSKRTEHLIYRATMEHMKNLRPDLFIQERYRFIDDRIKATGGDVQYWDTSPGFMLKDIIGSGIAVLNIGGWFDGFTRGTLQAYATLQGKGPARLLIAPRFHQPVAKIIKPYAEYLGYRGDWGNQQMAETLRFFDHYLKGRNNGIDREDPVYIYVANDRWRREKEWPLSRQRVQSFYLQEGSALSGEVPVQGKDSYDVDFTHASDYGEAQLNRWVMTKPSRNLMVRTKADRKCRVYDTAPLAVAVEVTGHPVANLYISSDRRDADVFVYLCDVDEKGTSVYVSEGELRAGWHRLRPDDEQVNNRLDIRPDLPWHGYTRNGYAKDPLAGGKVVQMRFDLMPVSWLFRKGHRIRIAVAGADTGNFELNPALCRDGKHCDPTTLYLHRGGAASSAVELPVIPR